MNFLVLISLLLWTIDTLLLQAEMALFGSTPLPNLVVKALLIFLMIVAGFARFFAGSPRPIPKTIFRLWLGFTLFLMIETPLLILRFGFPADYVLFSYNAYYFAILLIPLFFYFRETLSESLITTTLLVFFVPLSLLGLAQSYVNATFEANGQTRSQPRASQRDAGEPGLQPHQTQTRDHDAREGEGRAARR